MLASVATGEESKREPLHFGRELVERLSREPGDNVVTVTVGPRGEHGTGDRVAVGPWVMGPVGLADEPPLVTPEPGSSAASMVLPMTARWWHDDGGVAVLVTDFSGNVLRVQSVRCFASDGDVSVDFLRDLTRDLHRLAATQHTAGYHRGRGDARSMEAGKRARLTDDLLADVAAVYLAGGTRGRYAVATKWALMRTDPATGGQVPSSTADKWIAAARRRGFLGAAPGPGRAGSSSATASPGARKRSSRKGKRP